MEFSFWRVACIYILRSWR